MQFVNLTAKTIYTTYSGTLLPGQVSADGGPKRRKLEELLHEIVKVCGSSLGIRLNAAEAQLLNQLMTLDEMGGSFNKNHLPPEVRNDPTGAKRAAASVLSAQQKEAAARDAANRRGAEVEAEINGEIQTRKPVGPGTLQGEKVKQEDLKSGFELIMEENARIAAGQVASAQGNVEKKDVGEILDPIGSHAKQTKDGVADGVEKAPGGGDGAVVGADAGAPSGAGAEAGVEAEDAGDGEKSIGTEPAAVPTAQDRDDDGTRSADTMPPHAQAPEKGGKMDQKAAEVAAGLDQLGPVRGKGKGKNKGQK